MFYMCRSDGDVLIGSSGLKHWLWSYILKGVDGTVFSNGRVSGLALIYALALSNSHILVYMSFVMVHVAYASVLSVVFPVILLSYILW